MEEISYTPEDEIAWIQDPVTKHVALQCRDLITNIDSMLIELAGNPTVPIDEKAHRLAALTGEKSAYIELWGICTGGKEL
jgi:hypothetical protein